MYAEKRVRGCPPATVGPVLWCMFMQTVTDASGWNNFFGETAY